MLESLLWPTNHRWQDYTEKDVQRLSGHSHRIQQLSSSKYCRTGFIHPCFIFVHFTLLTLGKFKTRSNLHSHIDWKSIWTGCIKFYLFVYVLILFHCFLRAFLEKKTPKEELQKMFRTACVTHQDLYRDAMCGLGIDRHLFALYVVSKGMGYVSIHR